MIIKNIDVLIRAWDRYRYTSSMVGGLECKDVKTASDYGIHIFQEELLDKLDFILSSVY